MTIKRHKEKKEIQDWITLVEDPSPSHPGIKNYDAIANTLPFNARRHAVKSINGLLKVLYLLWRIRVHKSRRASRGARCGAWV